MSSSRLISLGFQSAAWARAASLGALALTAIAGSAGPAAAQGLFDFFNNRRWSHPPAYADPFQNLFGQRPAEAPRDGGGPVSFCVRTCDGRYFPIARNTGAAPAQICSALCPTAATKIYQGSSIDNATANGQRYADLGTAFVYREKIVPGCTCNGKDAFGLAPVPLASDPTLHTGDIVATNEGLMAVTAGRKAAEYTPVQSYTALPADLRARLAATKVAPNEIVPVPAPAKAPETTASVAGKAKRAQAEQPQRPAPPQRRWWFW